MSVGLLLLATVKTTTSNSQDHKTFNINAEEFWLKRSPDAVAEQRIRDIASNKNQWKTFDLHSSNGGRTTWKYQVHVQFDEVYWSGESIQN